MGRGSPLQLTMGSGESRELSRGFGAEPHPKTDFSALQESQNAFR